VELITEGEKNAVLGAVVEHEGKHTKIRDERGVFLAAGGFARNKEMRENYGPKPASVQWTSVPPGDHGDAVVAGMKVGAATAMTGDEWWGPTLMTPKPTFDIMARSFPFPSS
jgi:helvolic acid biosynthesis 3-ketosteroid Delta1-dehydrogenase